MDQIMIPSGLQITMDDVGWFCGSDDRQDGGSARSGMPRRHCINDYKAIHELGKRLNMKINCGFVLGEWDPDNRLKKIPCFSKYGDDWDNASYFRAEEAKKCVEIINNSPYIDIAVHGLMHNYYKKDANYSNTDYYCNKNGTYYPIPDDEIRMRLEAFFDLLAYHGIKKEVNSFIPPSFEYIWDTISKTLHTYGILYLSTIFDVVRNRTDLSMAEMENGIISLDRNNNQIEWWELSADPRRLPVVSGIFGCHWINILHIETNGYPMILDQWEEYFKKCSETFGVILSRDMQFYATQALYKKYTIVETENGALTLDIQNIPKAKGLGKCFYLSARKPIKSFTGCDMTVYEQHDGFINYEITPHDSVLTFTL